MASLIFILYGLILFMFILMGIFIIFHILKYSLDYRSALFMMIIFVSVFGTLLLSNLALFFNLKFEQIIPSFF